MTIDTFGRLMVAVVGLANILMLLPIVVLQLVEFVRRVNVNDGLQFHRLATATFVLATVAFLCWRLTIWLDQVIGPGAILPPTAARWRLDLVVGVTLLLLTSVLVVAFWRDRGHGRNGRGVDTATLVALAMRGETS